VINDENRGNALFFILKGIIRILKPNPQILNFEEQRAEYQSLKIWKECTFDPRCEKEKKEHDR